MRICKIDVSETIYGAGGPGIGGSGLSSTVLGMPQPLAAGSVASPTITQFALAPPAPATAPTFTPSVPSTINPTSGLQPSTSDNGNQGLPPGLCGPTVTGIAAGIGALGGPGVAAAAALVGEAIKDTVCPAPAAPAPARTSEAEPDDTPSPSDSSPSYAGADGDGDSGTEGYSGGDDSC